MQSGRCKPIRQTEQARVRGLVRFRSERSGVPGGLMSAADTEGDRALQRLAGASTAGVLSELGTTEDGLSNQPHHTTRSFAQYRYEVPGLQQYTRRDQN